MTYWVDLLGSEVRYLDTPRQTRAIISGDGVPMILLHGMGGHAENYSRNVSAFAEKFRVIALDMLWHGYSDLGGVTSEVIPTLVNHVVEAMDSLCIERAVIEGQSLGGWVAARLAADHPDRVMALTLTTPMGIGVDDPALGGTLDGVALRESNVKTLQDPSWENIKRRLERIVFDPKTLTEEAVAVRHKIYNRPGFAKTQIELTDAYFLGKDIKRYEITSRTARSIASPTLVYWGSNNLVGEATGRWLAEQIPNAEFYCALKTGHWAQYENADEHNRVVLDFLERNVKEAMA